MSVAREEEEGREREGREREERKRRGGRGKGGRGKRGRGGEGREGEGREEGRGRGKGGRVSEEGRRDKGKCPQINGFRDVTCVYDHSTSVRVTHLYAYMYHAHVVHGTGVFSPHKQSNPAMH